MSLPKACLAAAVYIAIALGGILGLVWFQGLHPSSRFATPEGRAELRRAALGGGGGGVVRTPPVCLETDMFAAATLQVRWSPMVVPCFPS